MSERARVSICGELQAALSVHFRNFNELDVVLAFHANPRMRFLPAKQLLPWDFPYSIWQRTHNWLASAMTLVGRCRRVTGHLYRGTEFEGEYYGKVQEVFSESELAHFVRCLRNYTLHHSIPLAQSRHSRNWSGATMYVDELLAWEGWNISARGYITKAAALHPLNKMIEVTNEMREAYPPEVIASLEKEKREVIGIRPCVLDYNRMIREFYSWLAVRQSDMHGAEPDWPEIAKGYQRMSLL